jgi:acetolactate synthase-1/2/3 large subunit
MRLTGGQMIVDYLISEGVEYVFAVPGHGNTALLDAFVDRREASLRWQRPKPFRC